MRDGAVLLHIVGGMLPRCFLSLLGDWSAGLFRRGGTAAVRGVSSLDFHGAHRPVRPDLVLLAVSVL